MSTNEKNRRTILSMAQLILQDEANSSVITPGLISTVVARTLAMMPHLDLENSREAVVDELIRRNSVWIGRNTTLASEEGHLPWFKVEMKQNWRYWQRYQEWQRQSLPWEVVDKLDDSTDEVLKQLENPEREGPWDRRGLVVGHVQSGKTGNYTGVICKAADAGYKIIIVLAGMHNNLRSQTQMRLDEGFLGFETNPNEDDQSRIIGVGLIDSDRSILPNNATNRSDKGDFNKRIKGNLGITPEQRPWLFVVKKNKSVLEGLLSWINDRVADTSDAETGRKIVTQLPLLMIDDEADNASVDTGTQVRDDEGIPDPEYEPKTINRLIRRILHAFERKAYVGYTATPFANIFIHEHGKTASEGADLFPESFIVNLAAPSNYVGPTKVFRSFDDDDSNSTPPLIRPVIDQCSKDGRSGWMPTSHKSPHVPFHESEEGMPQSLVNAVDSFVLSCAVRHLRGQGDKHCSMLVHVTRFTNVQKHVHGSVERYVTAMKQRLTRDIGAEEVVSRLHTLWVNDFVPTCDRMKKSLPDGENSECPDWGDVVNVLPIMLERITVRMINGTAKDALDYADSAESLKVIAIGGDKLARGLTLEGLSVSYFLRASRMYDTLMQMGRWFGYRHGYQDLCRLYTTPDLIEWFGHIADASEELREEFDLMVNSGGTPKDFGLKVLSHPVLLVTSQVKMRSSKTLHVSYSGTVVETVSMYRDAENTAANLASFRKLIAELPEPSTIPPRQRGTKEDRWKGAYWENVDSALITSFLDSYRTHPAAIKVNSQLIGEFIQKMNSRNELTLWTIAVIGGGVQAHPIPVSDSISVQRSKRSVRGDFTDRYAFGRLLNPRDEGIDFDEEAWLAALEHAHDIWAKDPARGAQNTDKPTTPSGPSFRYIRGLGARGIEPHPERGILFIYLLDPKSSGISEQEDADPVVAFGMSFPASGSSVTVRYEANNVLWENEYGAAE